MLTLNSFQRGCLERLAEPGLNFCQVAVLVIVIEENLFLCAFVITLLALVEYGCPVRFISVLPQFCECGANERTFFAIPYFRFKLVTVLLLFVNIVEILFDTFVVTVVAVENLLLLVNLILVVVQFPYGVAAEVTFVAGS